MDLGLKDRVYVVTGATRGLGFASARELAADGAKVIVTGRDAARAAEAAASLGPDAVGIAADNADPQAA
ncbi:SDR family NAD(P)-dependent oxidoreductase, partial [Streptomyces sp. SID7760]|nr:SDR family NAD(P)-dependent oxidoreductase [Streptomyces sp. SID7760]